MHASGARKVKECPSHTITHKRRNELMHNAVHKHGSVVLAAYTDHV